MGTACAPSPLRPELRRDQKYSVGEYADRAADRTRTALSQMRAFTKRHKSLPPAAQSLRTSTAWLGALAAGGLRLPHVLGACSALRSS
jgi:IS5 family transposase